MPGAVYIISIHYTHFIWYWGSVAKKKEYMIKSRGDSSVATDKQIIYGAFFFKFYLIWHEVYIINK